jgi:hypothetical protein
MIPHQALLVFEQKLNHLFARIDDVLEDKYGHRYTLHPKRPARGTTARKETNGLFDIGASYTLGIGSTYGKGYIVDVQIMTLEEVTKEVRAQIEQDVLKILDQELPITFPHQELKAVKDGNVIKIHGNLKLGEL